MFRAKVLGFRTSCLGLKVKGSGLRGQGLGFRVHGLGSLGLRVPGSRFQGLGFRAWELKSSNKKQEWQQLMVKAVVQAGEMATAIQTETVIVKVKVHSK